ncbi:MAG TPA: type II secretion system F family protein [bacterium]|nr:type II secretion system F family protein [bacterium]
MPIFSYKAKNEQGRFKTGQVVAVNESSAIKYINARGLSSPSIKEISEIEYRFLYLINPIKGKHLVVFSRQFSIMMTASVSVTDALLTIIEQTDNIKFKNIISKVAYDVNNGASLSDALKKHPKVFTSFYCSVVKAGETSGKLDNVLEYLADEIEKDYDLVKRFRGAMIYPAFVVCGLIIVGFVFMLSVLPNLIKILQETGGSLPLSTRIIIAVSNFLQAYLIPLIILVVILIIVIRFSLKTPAGRRRLDYITIKTPIIGSIFSLVYLVRFSSSLSTLLRGGVIVTRSLEIVRDIINNFYFREVITDTIDKINEGGSITDALNNSPYFPKMVPQIMMVGEKTGHLEESLDEISKFYGKELNSKLNNLNTLLEPLIMVIMGIGVAIMVAAIIMPMYNMASQF